MPPLNRALCDTLRKNINRYEIKGHTVESIIIKSREMFNSFKASEIWRENTASGIQSHGSGSWLQWPWCLNYNLTSDYFGSVKKVPAFILKVRFLISTMTEVKRTFLISCFFLMRETAKGIGQCHSSYFLANKIPSSVSMKPQAALGWLKNCFL